MLIHLHISEKQVEFATDKNGDLHIYAKGLEPAMPQRKRKVSRQKAPPVVTLPGKGIPYVEQSPPPETSPPDTSTPAEKLQTMLMDDKGWQ